MYTDTLLRVIIMRPLEMGMGDRYSYHYYIIDSILY